MLEKMGLYGLEKIEPAVLTGLVTGEPVLLVGGHGTAKTTLCRTIASRLGLSFMAYDAGKALFEDILGFPNPASLQGGSVDYVPTPISIWKKQFVLVDELSRAAPSMQNKWLEVIRSRRIMGLKLPDLRFVFAAMNPPTYLGAHPLDEALAGRFSLVITVPEVWDFEREQVLKVITNVTEDDSPYGGETEVAGEEGALESFVAEVRERLPLFPEGHSHYLASYVANLGEELYRREIPLDGRRLGMLWRTARAYLAVVDALEGRGTPTHPREREELLGDCMGHALPHAALGEPIKEHLLVAAHGDAVRRAGEPGSRAPVRFPKRPTRGALAFISGHRTLEPQARKAQLTRILERPWLVGPDPARAEAMASGCMLAEALCAGSLRLGSEDQYRILERFHTLTYFDDNMLDSIRSFFAKHYRGSQALEIRDGRTFTMLRIAVASERGVRGLEEPGVSDLVKVLSDTFAEIRSREGEQRGSGVEKAAAAAE